MLTIHLVIINFVLFSISAFLGIVEYDLEPTVTVVGRSKSSRTRNPTGLVIPCFINILSQTQITPK